MATASAGAVTRRQPAPASRVTVVRSTSCLLTQAWIARRSGSGSYGPGTRSTDPIQDPGAESRRCASCPGDSARGSCCHRPASARGVQDVTVPAGRS